MSLRRDCPKVHHKPHLNVSLLFLIAGHNLVYKLWSKIEDQLKKWFGFFSHKKNQVKQNASLKVMLTRLGWYGECKQRKVVFAGISIRQQTLPMSDLN